MKNTKNVLMTGVVLAMALFASVQMVAMETGRTVNKDLTVPQKKWVNSEIIRFQRRLEMGDPKKNPSQKMIELRNDAAQLLPKLEAIYYGHRPYTDDEIQQTLTE